MVSRAIGDRLRKNFCATRARLQASGGNVLVYIIVVMLIFAVLGVAMVSLFSTSISSSATANEQRRAFYLSESGLRYGMSELRKENGFSAANIATLNNTDYKMAPSGSFDIAIFGAWFFSPMEPGLNSKLFAPDEEVPLQVGKGKLPSAFFDKNLPKAVPDLFIVAVGNDLSLPDAVAKVKGFSNTPGDYTSFKFIVADDFRVSKEIPKTERGKVGMAVHPLENGAFTPSGDSTAYLDLPKSALNIFPKMNGSFMFRGDIYFYKTAKDEGDRFRLYNITARKGVEVSTKQIDKSTDYIILDYNNYLITSKGISGNITYGGDLDHAVSFREGNGNRLPDLNPTIADMQQIETVGNYISGGVDAKGDYMRVGGISGSNLGAMWFNQTVNFGGTTDQCTTGECLLGTGIRVFFTLEYSGSGDGLMFALFNGALNGTGSIGGDADLTELLGYGGDSRDSSGSFLDPNHGIKPPKIGLEFDAKRNWDQTFETKPVDFCGVTSLRQNTRNDPDPTSSAKDYIHYVYWGNSSLIAACRSNDPSYDDNRHDPVRTEPEDWQRSISGLINTSPAISPDGRTIYIGTNNNEFNPTVGRLYAFEVDDDGILKPGWETPIFTSSSITSPVLVKDGDSHIIYVGAGTQLFALYPNGSVKFSYNTAGTVTKPAIGGDGTIYIVANVAPKFGYVYAIRPDGSLKPGWTFNPQLIVSVVAAPYVTAPVMSTDNSRVYVAAREGSIYAFRETNGSVDWQRQPGGVINAPVGVDASAVYTGTNDKKVYALNATNGSIIWTSVLTASADYSSSPVVASGTVYIGNYDDHLYAINASNGTSKWQYFAAGNVQSTPFVDSNGTIYFGSDIRDFVADNNNVRALYSDGTEKWRFATGGDVRGTPAVKPDGTVYIGGFGTGVFYAINQFATPKSLKNRSITSILDGGFLKVGGVPVTVDDSDNWLSSKTVVVNSKTEIIPWAVRLEVDRSLDENLNILAPPPPGYFRYELRAWVRQCSKYDCSDELGSFYDDTRVTYYPNFGLPQNQRLPQMRQAIFLSPGLNGEHAYFTRFLFGFSSQTASGDDQKSTIRNFKLSFVRANDPTVTCDPKWPDGTICP